MKRIVAAVLLNAILVCGAAPAHAQLQVSAISGREFFDAVVPLEAIDAVLVRTKE